LVGARLRRHKVAGEQVGGVDEAGGLDVVGVVPGMNRPVNSRSDRRGDAFSALSPLLGLQGQQGVREF